MTLTSVGTTAASSSRSARAKPVIDIDAIRSILYLGVKGELRLARPELPSSSVALPPDSGRGVDTYA